MNRPAFRPWAKMKIEIAADPLRRLKTMRPFLKCSCFFLTLLQPLAALDADANAETHRLGLELKKQNALKEACELLASLPEENAYAFDYGIALFESGRYAMARSLLQPLTQNPSPSLKLAASLFIAKSYLEEENFKEADNTLKLMSEKELLPFSELKYEWMLARGDSAFRQKKWAESVQWLEQARPKRNLDLAPWRERTLALLAKAYVHLANDESAPAPLGNPEQQQMFSKAEEAYRELAASFPANRAPLELVQFYCSKAKALQDRKAWEAALSFLNALEDSALRAHTYLMISDAALSHEDRIAVLQSMTEDRKLEQTQQGLGHYQWGTSEFELAKQLSLKKHAAEADQHFAAAEAHFEKSQKSLTEPEKTAARQLQIESLIAQESTTSLAKALRLINEYPSGLPSLKAQALIKRGSPADLKEAKAVLLSAETDREMHYLLGSLYYKAGEFSEAEKAYTLFAETSPESPLAAKALYWAARAIENSAVEPNRAKALYRTLYEKYPQSELADVAYFLCYDYQDYLLGDRASSKHLHAFKSLYPDSPLLMNVCYLEGLDHLRDRRSPEGKWISRKNLTAAIDSFQEAESHYTHLEKTFPMDEWKPLLYQAMLERAKANFQIGLESKGAKRQIYFEYAEEEFNKLAQLLDPASDTALVEESGYYRALAQNELGNKKGAEASLGQLINRQKGNTLFTTRAKFQLGKLAAEKGNPQLAIDWFEKALLSGAAVQLSADEYLDLLIEKAIAYRASGELDLAMAQLSDAANYSAVSSLRLKAHYLRAEIYAEQGRPLLARKQLESLSLKGGEWAKKAKEKLDKDYGFD